MCGWIHDTIQQSTSIVNVRVVGNEILNFLRVNRIHSAYTNTGYIKCKLNRQNADFPNNGHKPVV